MIIFLKSSTSDEDRGKLPLREKLILIHQDRVKNADDEEDKKRAKRDLARIQACPPETD